MTNVKKKNLKLALSLSLFTEKEEEKIELPILKSVWVFVMQNKIGKYFETFD